MAYCHVPEMVTPVWLELHFSCKIKNIHLFKLRQFTWSWFSNLMWSSYSFSETPMSRWPRKSWITVALLYKLNYFCLQRGRYMNETAQVQAALKIHPTAVSLSALLLTSNHVHASNPMQNNIFWTRPLTGLYFFQLCFYMFSALTLLFQKFWNFLKIIRNWCIFWHQTKQIKSFTSI